MLCLRLAPATGFGPVTSRLACGCSLQLSYAGDEPLSVIRVVITLGRHTALSTSSFSGSYTGVALIGTADRGFGSRAMIPARNRSP
jgi:hypothetical protein